MVRTMRFVLVAFLLALSVPSGAATRYWLLQDVVFGDGAKARGSIGYDDVAKTVTSWNVRVEAGPGYLPFTFLPGNSIAYIAGGDGYYTANLAAPTIVLSSDVRGTGHSQRQLRITSVAALDGATTAVPIDLATLHGRSGSVECYNCGMARFIEAGSLELVPFPPPVGLVDVIEFYHAGLGHYVMSSDPPEIAGLDTGYFPGWTRTGESFKAYATGSSAGATMNPVCRYFKWPVGGVTTHFYSANAHECWLVDDLFGSEWVIESDNVFQIDLPDMATGACPGSTVPVYRLWNGVLPTNHRYTTSLSVRANMIALGWVPEGYGPIGVAMCAEGL